MPDGSKWGKVVHILFVLHFWISNYTNTNAEEKYHKQGEKIGLDGRDSILIWEETTYI